MKQSEANLESREIKIKKYAVAKLIFFLNQVKHPYFCGGVFFPSQGSKGGDK